MTELLKDEEFCRWVKSLMALEMIRSPMIGFVEPVIIKRHKEIVDKMRTYGQICLNCSFKDADRCPSCKIMKDEITKDHRFNRPTFRNTSIKDCFTNSLELAKCYMAVGNAMACSLSDTDTVGFLHLIINNMIFQHHTSENLNDMNNIFQQVREVRNFIMHSPENRTTKSTFDNQVKVIVGMLQSLHTPSSKRIIQKVKQLQTDKISLEDIQHANSEAVKFFRNYEAELRERIKECEHRMTKTEYTIRQGQHKIAGTIELGLHNIHEKTVHGERVIQDATNRGTKLLREETDVGIKQLDDKANKSTRILEEKEKVLEKHYKESREQLGEDISKIKDVRNEAIEALDKVEEIKVTVKLIDEKTNNDIDTIERVTQLCMEKLCEQTKASGETMKDTRDKLDDELKQRMNKRIGSEIEKYKNQMTEEIADAMNEKLSEMKQIENHIRTMLQYVDFKPPPESKMSESHAMKNIEDADARMNKSLSELNQFARYKKKRMEHTDNKMDEKVAEWKSFESALMTNMYDPDILMLQLAEIDQLNRLQTVDDADNGMDQREHQSEPISINTSHSDDKNHCLIVDMTKIDARRLAVVDRGNRSVKIIDVKKHRISNHLKLSVRPVAIACIDETHLVACGEEKLLYLRLDGTLREVNTIQLESEPQDVVSLNGEIGVLFEGPQPCFKILRLSGETKRYCTEGFLRPTYIATNRSKTILYVSDIDGQCIHMIDLNDDSHQLRIVRQINLSPFFQSCYPTCLTVDQNDNVYVAEGASHCIARISADGDIQTLIDGKDLPSRPISLEYCQTKNKLYVGFLTLEDILSIKIVGS